MRNPQPRPKSLNHLPRTKRKEPLLRSFGDEQSLNLEFSTYVGKDQINSIGPIFLYPKSIFGRRNICT